jgi:hypothetical protein
MTMSRLDRLNLTSGTRIAPRMQSAPRRRCQPFVFASLLVVAATCASVDAFAQDAPPADEPPVPPVEEPVPPPPPVAPSIPEPEPEPPPATTTAPAPPPPPPTTTPLPPPPPPPATTAPPSKPPPPPPASTAPLKVSPTPSPRATSTPPPAAAPPAKKEDEDDDTNGLFGPFRIGPVVGVGVPNLVSFGVTAKLTRFLGFGVNVGVIPKVQLSLYGDAELSYQEYDAYGRLYPFGGSFFLGAGVGYATMKGSYANDFAAPAELAPFGVTPGTPITVTTDGKVRSLVLTPQLGFFKTFGSGISIGIDIGAQVPIAPSTVESSTSVSGAGGLATTPQVQEQVTQGSQKVRDTLDKVGQQVVPTINLKLGFLL